MYPRIICHIMSSVDGRLLPERWTPPFDGTPAGELMGAYAAIGRKLHTDAWMFGKQTLVEGFFPKKFHTTDTTPAECPEAFAAQRSSVRLFVVADPKADILYESAAVRGDDIAVILPETAPAVYLEWLRRHGISYLFAGRDGLNLHAAMQTLGNVFGVKAVSLQGGGIINGAFLQSGLLDELSLVVYPGIDGAAQAPSVFEYIGDDNLPTRGQSLELMSAETMRDGIVWLRYRFHK